MQEKQRRRLHSRRRGRSMNSVRRRWTGSPKPPSRRKLCESSRCNSVHSAVTVTEIVTAKGYDHKTPILLQRRDFTVTEMRCPVVEVARSGSTTDNLQSRGQFNSTTIRCTVLGQAVHGTCMRWLSARASAMLCRKLCSGVRTTWRAGMLPSTSYRRSTHACVPRIRSSLRRRRPPCSSGMRMQPCLPRRRRSSQPHRRAWLRSRRLCVA